jgi:hypothetical protein
MYELVGQCAFEVAVIDRFVAGLAGCCPIILHNEHPDRAGPAARMANRFDVADQPVDVLVLALADLGQRIPKLRLQPHAGAATLGNDIAIDESTACHGCPLFSAA